MSTLTESNFTKADGTNIDGSLTWVDLQAATDGTTGIQVVDSFDIVSNTAQSVVTNYYYSLSKAGNLATADHSAQVTIKNAGDASGVTSHIGPTVRMAGGSSGVCYFAALYRAASPSVILGKMNAIGAVTVLNTLSVSLGSDPINKVLKLTVSGTAPAHLVVNFDGTDLTPYDDSSSPITGNTGVGIFGYHNVSATIPASITAFNASDSGAATVPNAPTIGTATAGDAAASITFTESTSDGGATITNHTMTSTPGSFTGTGLTSPISVTGLANGGTAYTFKVKSTNSVGDSTESAASNSVTPASVTNPTLAQITTAMNAAVAGLLTTVQFNAAGLVTTAQLNTAITNLATVSQLNAALAALATKDNVGVIREGVCVSISSNGLVVPGAAFPDNDLIDCLVLVRAAGQAAWQPSNIAQNVGNTISVDPNWKTLPVTTPIAFQIIGTPRQGSSMNSFNRAIRGNVMGTVGTGSTTSNVVVSAFLPAPTVTDQFKNRMIVFSDTTTTAALRGQASAITGSTTGTLTVVLTTAPVSGDIFSIT